MAETLSNINSFLAEAANQSSVPTNELVYTQEAVIIDTTDRKYDGEIHLTNPANTYNGNYYTNIDGVSVNILSIASAGANLTSNIDQLSTKINTNKQYLLDTIRTVSATTYTSAYTNAFTAAKSYTDTKFLTSYPDAITRINTVSSNLICHINNGDINAQHVTKDGTVQIGLNAEKLGGCTSGEIISKAARYAIDNAINNIKIINCGRI